MEASFCTSSYLPQEIIYACGLTPVRLQPGNSLTAADGYLPRNFSVETRAADRTACQRRSAGRPALT